MPTSCDTTATVLVTLSGAVGRADIGETLVDIATELGRALGDDDIDELIASALDEFAERSKSGVARHAAAILRGDRKGGRPKIDLEMYVDEAIEMHKSSLVKTTLSRCFLSVARTVPGTASLRSKANLLRKRHLDRKISAAKEV
jgi:hypothetical protein